MQILNFVKNYWIQIVFFIGVLTSFFSFAYAMVEATKCSLRNDILAIWDRCKEKKQITQYQLQAVLYSYKIYKKLGGNSFVDEIIKQINSFEIID